MKIKSLQLRNFKRFTDLTLKDIPETTKLVLLIGSNGSGKSSVFDSFEHLANQNQKGWVQPGEYRLNKNAGQYEIIIETYEYGKEGIFGNMWHRSNKIQGGSFYGRTSFRQIPRLTRTRLGGSQFDIISDTDRPPTFIDRDGRFENDLEHIFGKLLKEFFRNSDDKSEIKEKIVNPINAAFERIFGHKNGTKLKLIELIPPLEGRISEINFEKGGSVFHYNYLSAGEKEVFNILINFLARGEYYTNTIFYFDEIDLHLNTKLQYNFLKEIVENWVPDNCQFWTASHSLGFIQYAKEKENAILFDFDEYDFDVAKVLSPEPKDGADIYEIAVSKDILPYLFKDRKIVFVENEDRKFYASLNIDKTIFVPEKNRDGVFFKTKAGHFSGLIDRDFLTDDDIKIIVGQYPNLKILNYYCVENYLYHPDNFEEYSKSNNRPFEKSMYIKGIIEEKQKTIKELVVKVASVRQGYPFFKEPGNEKSTFRKRFMPEKENFEQTQIIISYLESEEIDQFLKSFSMKDYCKSIPERLNVNPYDLSKTEWFRKRIEEVLR